MLYHESHCHTSPFANVVVAAMLRNTECNFWARLSVLRPGEQGPEQQHLSSTSYSSNMKDRNLLICIRQVIARQLLRINPHVFKHLMHLAVRPRYEPLPSKVTSRRTHLVYLFNRIAR